MVEKEEGELKAKAAAAGGLEVEEVLEVLEERREKMQRALEVG